MTQHEEFELRLWPVRPEKAAAIEKALQDAIKTELATAISPSEMSASQARTELVRGADSNQDVGSVIAVVLAGPALVALVKLLPQIIDKISARWCAIDIEENEEGRKVSLRGVGGDAAAKIVESALRPRKESEK
jgi:hypothetical protein